MALANQAFIKDSMELKDGYTRIQKNGFSTKRKYMQLYYTYNFFKFNKNFGTFNHHRHSTNRPIHMKNDSLHTFHITL
jgi:hypothetical protein